MSNKFPDNADAAGPRNTFGEVILKEKEAMSKLISQAG